MEFDNFAAANFSFKLIDGEGASAGAGASDSDADEAAFDDTSQATALVVVVLEAAANRSVKLDAGWEARVGNAAGAGEVTAADTETCDTFTAAKLSVGIAAG